MLRASAYTEKANEGADRSRMRRRTRRNARQPDEENDQDARHYFSNVQGSSRAMTHFMGRVQGPGRVGSGQDVSKTPRVGPGRSELTRPDP